MYKRVSVSDTQQLAQPRLRKPTHTHTHTHTHTRTHTHTSAPASASTWAPAQGTRNSGIVAHLSATRQTFVPFLRKQVRAHNIDVRLQLGDASKRSTKNRRAGTRARMCVCGRMCVWLHMRARFGKQELSDVVRAIALSTSESVPASLGCECSVGGRAQLYLHEAPHAATAQVANLRRDAVARPLGGQPQHWLVARLCGPPATALPAGCR